MTGPNAQIIHDNVKYIQKVMNMQESVLIYKPEKLMPLLRVSRNTIYELLRSGKIRSVKVGKRYLIPQSAVYEFLNIHTILQ